MRRGRRWHILMTRDGNSSSRRFGVSARRAAAVIGGAGVILGAAAFWAGFSYGGERAAVRHAELQARVDSLTEENAKVATLAVRLEELEAGYDRMRAVMGGDVAPSARDILLPPIRSESSASTSREPRRNGEPILWPLVEAGFVTRSFGDSVPGEEAHRGLDIAVPVGSYVRSVGAGVVSKSGEDPEYGRYVRIDHADGYRTLYAHNSWTFVASGDSVEAGEVIALSGNTGRSTAPHLHLELERGGAYVDPLPFISERT